MERILFLPGDGQGPASVDAAMRIVSAVDGAVEAAVGDIGSAAYEKYGSSLPYETLDLVGGCPVIVSGPTQESIDGRDPLADLMGQMDLYGRRRRFVTLADGLGVPGTDVTIWGTSASGRAGISETRDVDGVTISKHIGTAVYARIMAAAMTDMELRGACRAECIAREDLFPEASGSIYESFDLLFQREGIESRRCNVTDWVPRFVSDPASFGFIVASDLYAIIAERLAASFTGGISMSPLKLVGGDSTLILPCGESGTGNSVSAAMTAVYALEDIGHREEAARAEEAVRRALAEEPESGRIEPGAFADLVVSMLRRARPSIGIFYRLPD